MNTVNQPPDDPKDDQPDAKAVVSLIEKLSLAGHSVYSGKHGDFLVSKWGLSRHCQDSESLRDFARQLGVKS